MASSNTRLKIVQLAVGQAGRGAELYDHAKDLLNVLLRSWALKKKWPQLRKVGTTISVSQGAQTVSLPADFGFGMDSLHFVDTTNLELVEKDIDEFSVLGGFPASNQSSGVPSCYYIDKEAGLIRFNCPANKAYTLQPIYYKIPAAHPLTSPGDDEYPWYDDDKGLIEGLVEMIYQYTQDDREMVQSGKTANELSEFRRGSSPMSGGSSTIPLSSSFFKRRGR